MTAAAGGSMSSRRDWFKSFAGGALAAALTSKEALAEPRVDRAARGLASPRIRDVQVIAVQPGNVRLVIVKILTDQDGLYGYGCATFTQRAEVVVTAVQQYLKPFLVGRPADRIEDTWQSLYNSSYWRNGPVLNNAISGVDQALWDIKGRQTGLPVYQLLGGRSREAVELYTGVNGRNVAQLVDSIRKAQTSGYRHFRFNVGGGEGGGDAARGPNVLHAAPLFDRESYRRAIVKAFEGIRKELGDEVEVMCDVHEKLTPTQALQLCKQVEQYRPYFIEDPLSPEDLDYYRVIREQCGTPIAMGELFNNPHEWMPLISGRLIDYIRVHVSQAGGLTPARKIAILGEWYGVRTAWHGPADVSPVGHCANVTLSLTAYNFGIQEMAEFSDATREIFKGCPEVRNGYAYPNEAPGWGVEIDEKAVAKYPFRHDSTTERSKLNYGWGDLRLPDGTVIKQ
jgi:mannonate dehydratase